MLKCGSLQLMVSGRGGVEEGLSFLLGSGQRKFDYAAVSINEQHKLDLVHFSFWGSLWWCKSGKVDLGGMGRKCDQGALYEIPK